MTNQPLPLTPLERLLQEKRRVAEACELRKLKLNADCAYIQANAGSLLLSGLSSLLFPGSSKPQGAKAGDQRKESTVPGTMPLGWGDLLILGKSLWPVAWEVAQPLIVSWGMRKATKWFSRLLFSEKK